MYYKNVTFCLTNKCVHLLVVLMPMCYAMKVDKRCEGEIPYILDFSTEWRLSGKLG